MSKTHQEVKQFMTENGMEFRMELKVYLEILNLWPPVHSLPG